MGARQKLVWASPCCLTLAWLLPEGAPRQTTFCGGRGSKQATNNKCSGRNLNWDLAALPICKQSREKQIDSKHRQTQSGVIKPLGAWQKHSCQQLPSTLRTFARSQRQPGLHLETHGKSDGPGRSDAPRGIRTTRNWSHWAPLPSQEACLTGSKGKAEKSTKQPAASQPAGQPASQPTNQPTNQPTSQPASQATNRTTKQPNNQTNQTSKQPNQPNKPNKPNNQTTWKRRSNLGQIWEAPPENKKTRRRKGWLWASELLSTKRSDRSKGMRGLFGSGRAASAHAVLAKRHAGCTYM